MTAYYNEHDPFAAAWLRNLIAAGLIAPGDVDERSIEDVQPDDLKNYTQAHFFAGIGGWSYALRLAGWPDDQPVWTGSCPCQPFSLAGARRGFDDARHLWPVFFRLISQRQPSTVFGEQVASAADWLRGVRSDLETVGYAVGAIPMEAASADADHFRDRYWFVAHHDQQFPGESRVQPGRKQRRAGGPSQDNPGFVADCNSQRSQIEIGQPSDVGAERAAATRDRLCPVVNPPGDGWGEGWTEHEFRSRGFTAAVASIDGCQFVECPDGKWRRIPPPRVRWLGTGLPARVAKLRALGNAIDPRPASEFIGAYLETCLANPSR